MSTISKVCKQGYSVTLQSVDMKIILSNLYYTAKQL